MVIVKEAKTNDFTKEAEISVFADTKSEVTNDPTDYQKMPSGFTIAPGSTLMTASGDMAFMKSDGTWNWV